MYGIIFNPDSGQSQYRQLVDQLRAKITSGAVPGGTKLASTRELAESLGIARGIVLEAVDQLKMEGFLRTAHGAGTFVRESLVWESGSAPAPTAGEPDAAETGVRAGSSREASSLLSFAPGMPDLDLFPRRQWTQCYRDAIEYATSDDLAYCPPSGRMDLRIAISRYLRATKGILAGPERIIVTAGSSQAIAILASLFPRARVAMEDPQAPFIRRIFDGLGCEISYVTVDDEGIVPDRIPDGPLDLIYATPNHHFPVGGTLGAERRIALLQRARAAGAWIIEDDFDSEFRYEGHPVTPLAVMAGERVAYVGTFSKNVSPALRLGYLVVPQGLQSKVKTLKRRWDLLNEGLQQKAMAKFIDEGHLERHLMRCHRAYGKKNRFLRELVEARLAPDWRVIGATTGMHLALRRASATGASARKAERLAAVPPTADAAYYTSALRERGFLVETVDSYCRENRNFRDCLIVAFGNRSEEELSRLVGALAEIG